MPPQGRMHPDHAHAAAGVAMWGSLGLCAASVALVIPAQPAWGAAMAAVCAAGAVLSAYFKKRYCPRCRGGQCRLPPNKTDSS
jgi:hypothetical protein